MARSTEIFVNQCPPLGEGTIPPWENKDADILFLSAAVNAVKLTTKFKDSHLFAPACVIFFNLSLTETFIFISSFVHVIVLVLIPSHKI